MHKSVKMWKNVKFPSHTTYHLQTIFDALWKCSIPRKQSTLLKTNTQIFSAVIANPQQQFSHGYQQCMAEVTKLLLSSTVDQSVTSKLVDHLTQRSAAPRQFQFVNIPQHQITKPASKLPQLSTPKMPTLSPKLSTQIPQMKMSPQMSELSYAKFSSSQLSPSQFASYPSPPNSPVYDQSPSASPVALPQRLPSVARRPQPQRAHAVWRPWWWLSYLWLSHWN